MYPIHLALDLAHAAEDLEKVYRGEFEWLSQVVEQMIAYVQGLVDSCVPISDSGRHEAEHLLLFTAYREHHKSAPFFQAVEGKHKEIIACVHFQTIAERLWGMNEAKQLVTEYAHERAFAEFPERTKTGIDDSASLDRSGSVLATDSVDSSKEKWSATRRPGEREVIVRLRSCFTIEGGDLTVMAVP